LQDAFAVCRNEKVALHFIKNHTKKEVPFSYQLDEQFKLFKAQPTSVSCDIVNLQEHPN
jgi:hypothetical protein